MGVLTNPLLWIVLLGGGLIVLVLLFPWDITPDKTSSETTVSTSDTEPATGPSLEVTAGAGGVGVDLDTGAGIGIDLSDGSVTLNVGGVRIDTDGDGPSIKLF